MTTILVVEDEAVIAADIRATLEDLGYVVPPAAPSSDAALRGMAAHRPDLVLMDIRIEGEVDGVELSARIRDSYGTPIVYLTSHSDDATVSRAKATGAYGYVLKPFTDRTLRTAIEVALKRIELEKLELENERHRSDRGRRVVDRELESMSYSLAHELRTPLRALTGFSDILLEIYRHKLDADGLIYLTEIRAGAVRMAEVNDAMLAIAKLTRTELEAERTDLSQLARDVGRALAARAPKRIVELAIAEGLQAEVDPALARILLESLLGNAWKFTARAAEARIELGAIEKGGEVVFFVRDNGVGFDMDHVDKLFVPFQSLHAPGEFPGVKIGLAMSHRIVERHGGRIWAEAATDEGATFFVALPEAAVERSVR